MSLQEEKERITFEPLKGTPRKKPRRRKSSKVVSVVEQQEDYQEEISSQTLTPGEVKAPPLEVDEVVKKQTAIFEPNPGPQTEFLESSEEQVLYGGAAGGGKSYAMVADVLRNVNCPGHRGVLLRRTTDELRELKAVAHNLYPQLGKAETNQNGLKRTLPGHSRQGQLSGLLI